MSEMRSIGEVPGWTLGDRLSKALRCAGMTTDQMAARLGYGRSTISRYINDRGAPPRRGVITQWSMITGVPREWLETGTDPHETGPDGGSDLPNSRSRCTVVHPAQWVPAAASAGRAA
jgi:transcriptional regulator with XRE-family HTH domain